MMTEFNYILWLLYIRLIQIWFNRQTGFWVVRDWFLTFFQAISYTVSAELPIFCDSNFSVIKYDA